MLLPMKGISGSRNGVWNFNKIGVVHIFVHFLGDRYLTRCRRIVIVLFSRGEFSGKSFFLRSGDLFFWSWWWWQDDHPFWCLGGFNNYELPRSMLEWRELLGLFAW